MTGKRARSGGGGEKIVRRRLADGSVREYRYPLHRPAADDATGSGIKQLATAYLASPEFKRLSARWRAAQRYYLGLIENRLGWMTLADLQSREARDDFYELRDAMADTPHAADKTLNTLKCLVGWAVERGKMDIDRAHGIKRLSPSGKTRADKVWTEDHEAVVYARFPASLQQAWRFALYSAMRQSDMCALRWEQYRDGWITYQPAKTRGSSAVVVHLPVHALAPFRELIDGLSRGTEYMLTTETGQPLDATNLRARWRQAMARTELAGEDLHWHDLRGTAVTRMLEAGCSDAEVAAITGHVIGGGSSLSDYAARVRPLALHAYCKWNSYLAAKPAVVDFRRRAENGEKIGGK